MPIPSTHRARLAAAPQLCWPPESRRRFALEIAMLASRFIDVFPSSSQPMAMRKKNDLPEKICVQCGRPFRWRKKWERVWDAVKYCSDRCRGDSKRHRPIV